jgi:hypothetical protein
MALTFSAASDRIGAGRASTAILWILLGASLVLFSLLNWTVQVHYPGITSLFRQFSKVALAGLLMLGTASLRLLVKLDSITVILAALAGFGLTLIGATSLQWLVRNVRVDGPLPDESLALEKLAALQKMLAGARH